MDDLISRQAAIDAIHCDITVTGRQNAELVATTIGAFADRIKALPSVEPEIIHCKECRFAHMTYDGDCKYCDVWFPYESEYLDGDYYCASAERKIDEFD